MCQEKFFWLLALTPCTKIAKSNYLSHKAHSDPFIDINV